LADLEQIVERCRQGDALAWETLVRQYQSRVYTVTYHYLRNPEEARDVAQDVFVQRNPEEARDVAQDVFIQVYRGLDKFRGDRFVPWLLRLARNCSIDRLRRIKARPPADDVPVEDARHLTAGGPSPEDAWLTDSKKRLVHRALGEMSEQNREIILLKEIQGLNFREIAEMLGVPIGTVKSRSNRARIDLAQRVVALDPAYGSA